MSHKQLRLSFIHINNNFLITMAFTINMIKRVLIVSKKVCLCPIIINRKCLKTLQRQILTSAFIITVPLLSLLIYRSIKEHNMSVRKPLILEETNLADHYRIVNQYFKMRENWNTSKLGSIMFKNDRDIFPNNLNKLYRIYFLNHWDWFQVRHVHKYAPKKRTIEQAMRGCSVHNCVFLGEPARKDTVDAVVVNLKHGEIPHFRIRKRKEIWIFLSDESPINTFIGSKFPIKLERLANTFHWSMTYRSNADIPIPYGRTIPLTSPLLEDVTDETIIDIIPNYSIKRMDVHVVILLSNCHVPFRMEFVYEFQKHIKINFFGKCSKPFINKCPGHFLRNCDLLDRYYFYLVVENSFCHQYITEKMFFNAYTKGAIPIVVGPSTEDCKTLLPPNSYIHSDDYESLEELAEKVRNTINNKTEFLSYHLWRNHFNVTNEHGFFGTSSYNLCRMCEALNYNDKPKKLYSLEDISLFLDSNMSCRISDGQLKLKRKNEFARRTM